MLKLISYPLKKETISFDKNSGTINKNITSKTGRKLIPFSNHSYATKITAGIKPTIPPYKKPLTIGMG